MSRIVLVWLLAQTAAGCCPHNKCAAPPSVEVNVTSSGDGVAVPGVRIAAILGNQEIELTPCMNQQNTCRTGHLNGKARISISAPEYATTSFEFESKSDECGMVIPQRFEVYLEKASSARTALVNRSELKNSCD